jgi:hypothetical protein
MEEDLDDEEAQMYMPYGDLAADDVELDLNTTYDQPINMVSLDLMYADPQDADFEDEQPRKKSKKSKGKNKGIAIKLEDEEADLTVAEKASKVKEAMEAYKSLDHEDMVCP